MTKKNSVGIRNAMILVDGELKSGHHQRMKKGVIVISDSSFQKNFNIQWQAFPYTHPPKDIFYVVKGLSAYFSIGMGCRGMFFHREAKVCSKAFRWICPPCGIITKSSCSKTHHWACPWGPVQNHTHFDPKKRDIHWKTLSLEYGDFGCCLRWDAQPFVEFQSQRGWHETTFLGSHKNPELKVFLYHDSILEGVSNPNIHILMFKKCIKLEKKYVDTLKTPVFFNKMQAQNTSLPYQNPIGFKSFLHYRTSQICFSRLFDKLLLIEGLEDSIDVLRRNTNPRIIHFNVNLPFLIVIAARHRDASLMCEPGSRVSKLHLESWKKKQHVGWVLHTCEVLQICLGQHVCILYFCIFHQRDILASLYDTNFYIENLDQ